MKLLSTSQASGRLRTYRLVFNPCMCQVPKARYLENARYFGLLRRGASTPKHAPREIEQVWWRRRAKTIRTRYQLGIRPAYDMLQVVTKAPILTTMVRTPVNPPRVAMLGILTENERYSRRTSSMYKIYRECW